MSEIQVTDRMAILTAAISTYGMKAQQDMALEEMSELTKAILKTRRAHTGPELTAAFENVLEEIADVQIMLDQMKLIYGDTQEQEAEKLARLKGWIEDATAGKPVPVAVICPGGCPLNYGKPQEHCEGCTSRAMEPRRLSCFYCQELILDGCGSWCRLRKAGEVCDDFKLNMDRFVSCQKARK